MQESAAGRSAAGADIDEIEAPRAPVGASVSEVSPARAASIAAFHVPVLAAGIAAYVELPHHAVSGFVSFILIAMGVGGVGFAGWHLLLWAVDRLDSRGDHGSPIPS